MDVNTSSTNQLDVELDIIGQQPGLTQLYTQICFCFSMPDTATLEDIVYRLNTGLVKLSASFPWLTGQVVQQGSIFKIKPLNPSPRLVVKDLRNDPSVPSMEDMEKAEFPFTMLDESVIAPRNTLNQAYSPPNELPLEVLVLQATFVRGGMILTINANHGTMDGTGQGQVIRLLSKACRGEEFTSEEVSTGQLAGRNLIPCLGEREALKIDIAHQLIKNTTTTTAPTSQGTTVNSTETTPDATWAYFNFSASALRSLKALANESLTGGFVSTDDALTALIWQSVSRARLPRLAPNTHTAFTRAVDIRAVFDIAPTYPGMIQNMTYHAGPTLEALVAKPLGVIAADLRAALDPRSSNYTLKPHSQALATYMRDAADKSIVKFTADIDHSSGLMLSSWAKLEYCATLDFGLQCGVPLAVRRPRFTPVLRLAYLMPRSREGDVALGICLRDDDLMALRRDEVFGRFAKFVG
jgi:trichothecene 3-O-acetyltransferase